MADQKDLGSIATSTDNIETLRHLAQCAEDAEQYEDMCTFVKRLVELQLAANAEISSDDRNLLSVAFKNRVGGSRHAARSISVEDLEAKDETALAKATAYKSLMSQRVEDQCNEIIDLLINQLVPKASEGSGDPATYVFYTKMTADYYRYAAEATTNDDKRNEYKEGAKTYYNKAWEKATAPDSLEATSPIRLGLALNFSVCHYEILDNKEEACKMAKNAFDDAIAKLDKLGESDYKDSTLIMQLLRDNLTLWTQEDNE